MLCREAVREPGLDLLEHRVLVVEPVCCMNVLLQLSGPVAQPLQLDRSGLISHDLTGEKIGQSKRK